MSLDTIIQLAARHQISAADLTEAWHERTAIREHLSGFTRRAAEVFAIGDVEAMFKIGLHCPDTIRRMREGGNRKP